MLVSIIARSQEKESFYVYDANWKPTVVDSAHFFLRRHQVNDTCWQWDYYNFTGPLLRMERTRDKDRNIMEGTCYHYNEKGWIDSSSEYKHGKRNGDFYKYTTDSLRDWIKYVYRDDSLIEVLYEKDQKKDSVISYKDEKESEYPGVAGSWARYLGKNLKYPARAQNASIQGEVRVFFIVDTKGEIHSPEIAKSVEYSLDEETLRIIRASGKWIPAFQNGKFVKSFKMQPLVFRLE